MNVTTITAVLGYSNITVPITGTAVAPNDILAGIGRRRLVEVMPQHEVLLSAPTDVQALHAGAHLPSQQLRYAYLLPCWHVTNVVLQWRSLPEDVQKAGKLQLWHPCCQCQ